MLKKIVNGLEVVALLAAGFTVVMLFAGGSGADEEEVASGPADLGAEVFASSCASCHGADGGGGVGPQLSDGAVIAAFPDAADEIVVVTEGRGGMPAFGGDLSAEEIAAVVEFTRTTLAGEAAGGEPPAETTTSAPPTTAAPTTTVAEQQYDEQYDQQDGGEQYP